MLLLRTYLRRDLKRLVDNGVRLKVIGRRDRLPHGLAAEIDTAEKASALGTRLELTVAIDYSARDAIANAAAGWLGDNSPPRAAFSAPAGVAGPRNGARCRSHDPPRRREKRLSDFLLWDAAYAELLFSDRQCADFGLSTCARAGRLAHPRAGNPRAASRRRCGSMRSTSRPVPWPCHASRRENAARGGELSPSQPAAAFAMASRAE